MNKMSILESVPMKKRDPAEEMYMKGVDLLMRHPLFSPMASHAYISRSEKSLCPKAGWAVVSEGGDVDVHPDRLCTPEEWLYVLAHCLLHLGFNHFIEKNDPHRWNVACDCIIARFLADMKLGRRPDGIVVAQDLPGGTEEQLFEELSLRGVPDQCGFTGTAGGPQHRDMIFTSAPGQSRNLSSYQRRWHSRPTDWPALLARGVAAAVSSAVQVAAGQIAELGSESKTNTAAQRARTWFLSSYPLLGSLAASFAIIEDPLICNRLEVSVAAVDEELQEIYINPAAGMDDLECRFVLAHEFLHVGLRHSRRTRGRDSYLWNVACDYVINGWLIEMGIGELPQFGLLYDPELKGMSAETIYDQIVLDMRRYRKLATLRGFGLGDILGKKEQGWWHSGEGLSLDDFYRGCLAQGLIYHQDQGRGYLPGDLIEEIRSISQPPIPWDVELARWFDNCFSPIEKIRSYARPSRRQSATPDIPRPRWIPAEGSEEGRTFGVILDTSGSMDRALLGKALGAIASYSVSRDVPLVRVIFCDAAAYDQGYIAPEALLEHVKVRGRGGTVLQPAIDLLENTHDFPPKGPFLVITDGVCDRLHIRREHAFIMPLGGRLPFTPKGEVFWVR